LKFLAVPKIVTCLYLKVHEKQNITNKKVKCLKELFSAKV